MREYFPAIKNNPDIICFDNAATTQIPSTVLGAIRNYYNQHANPGRGAYDWAEQAEETVHETRASISTLTGLPDPKGVIFTNGTTMSLNMVVQCWARHNLKSGDEVLLCLSDHHSMVLPWQQFAKETGIILHHYRLHANGSIDIEDLRSKMTGRTKLCCITHINNTAGWVNDLTAIRDALPKNVLLNVDAAQSISHAPLDMSAQGIDFLSFSGHKMFALGGIGVLCLSRRVQDHMNPLFYGGGMAEFKEADPIYKKFEAGTLNMAGIVSLKAACDFIRETNIQSSSASLSRILYQHLLSNPRIDMIYEQKPYALDHLCGIASFTLEGMDSGELADILAEHGIFVRAGRHCTGIKESVRISLQGYNTKEEIIRFFELLDHIIKDI